MSEPSPLQCSVLPTADGRGIGVLTLDQPKTLNALSLDMVQALQARLDAWRDDPAIVAVWLDSSSDKAFCAGGDLQQLYRSMREYGSGHNPYFADFFAREYRLDYTVHRYPKPVVAWLQGVVMGGGVGLGCAASNRVVTEATRLAMPEITVGLFPDVGGSWFLSRIPGGVGLYLGLTGTRQTAGDAIATGFADCAISHGRKAEALASLQAQRFSGRGDADQAIVRTALLALTEPSIAEQAPLLARWTTLMQVGAAATLADCAARIEALALRDDWYRLNAQALASGCPSSALLTWTLFHRARHASLADVLRLEYAAALGCGAHGDFAEGIRALLIDKDKTPHWNPASIARIEPGLIDELLRPRWKGPHPLANLETDIRNGD